MPSTGPTVWSGCLSRHPRHTIQASNYIKLVIHMNIQFISIVSSKLMTGLNMTLYRYCRSLLHLHQRPGIVWLQMSGDSNTRSMASSLLLYICLNRSLVYCLHWACFVFYCMFMSPCCTLTSPRIGCSCEEII
jgi:hypothetical protein